MLPSLHLLHPLRPFTIYSISKLLDKGVGCFHTPRQVI
jgi:hypothetical protein